MLVTHGDAIKNDVTRRLTLASLIPLCGVSCFCQMLLRNPSGFAFRQKTLEPPLMMSVDASEK